MGAFETLIYEKTENVATVTLNRPKALNAYNIQMRDDLYEVLGAIKNDGEVHACVLRGAGEKAFCAGADLSEFLTAPPPTEARHVRWERDVWGRFLKMPQPIIAALHGYVLGSGIEMALCCDIRIASQEARFGLPEVALGIIPAAGGSQTLPRTVCPSIAMDMLLTNRWIDAEEALRAKLIHRIVPPDDVLSKAVAIAKKIASFEPLAVKAAKEAIMRGMDVSLVEGLALEERLASSLFAPPDL